MDKGALVVFTKALAETRDTYVDKTVHDIRKWKHSSLYKKVSRVAQEEI